LEDCGDSHNFLDPQVCNEHTRPRNGSAQWGRILQVAAFVATDHCGSLEHENASAAIMNKFARLLLATLITCVGWAHLALGATITFDGGASGTGTALDNNLNWLGDVPPTTNDEVLFSTVPAVRRASPPRRPVRRTGT
jgi:hypothetical protein